MRDRVKDRTTIVFQKQIITSFGSTEQTKKKEGLVRGGQYI